MTRSILIYIGCIIAFLFSTGQSYAQVDSGAILGVWLLDEGEGDIAEDVSGNGHNGAIIGAPNWVTGQFGNALEFVSGSYVDCGNDPALNVDLFSVSFWCNIATTQGWLHMVSRGQHFGGGNPGANNWGVMMVDGASTIRYEVFNDTGWATIEAQTTIGEWHHVVATYDGGSGELELYHDGVSAATGSGGVLLREDKPLFIGAQSRDGGPGGSFVGSIDEVGYFNAVLTPEDIQTIMTAGLSVITGGQPLARKPDPADGAIHSNTWVTLSWTSGDFAVSHDVYLGENFDDIQAATRNSEAYRINQNTTFYVAGFPGFAYPEGLVPGTTYYWRIDEVNDANPDSPWKGDVWSFTIPPKTAYNPDPADGADSVPLTATLNWTGGFNAKLHIVYFGDNFDDISNATAGLPQGASTYKPASLQSEKIYYWRVDEFDGVDTYKGDVWGFSTPGAVESPQPTNDATGEPKNVLLIWTPAANAISHDVYFGTDKDAVKNATTASAEYMGNKALGSESHDPGILVLGTTYYWRVDAVYNSGPVKGLVWSFTIADFIMVDDFESYNDFDPPDPNSNRIFDSWIDGFGTTDNGALVGNDLPPYAEQTIVHGGAQSMIYRYDNANKTSEATLTLVYPRDWIEEGVTKLSLWFRGASVNAADRMYVALNGNEVVYHDDPAATQKAGWNQWLIGLQEFADQGVNLTIVDTITIGIGTKDSPVAGGTGTMYFDDIRLIR